VRPARAAGAAGSPILLFAMAMAMAGRIGGAQWRSAPPLAGSYGVDVDSTRLRRAHGVAIILAPASQHVNEKEYLVLWGPFSHGQILFRTSARIGGWAGTQPFAQLRPTPPARDVAYRDSDSFLLANQHDEPLAAGDAGVDQISLQHRVVLRHERDHYRGVFLPLALVNRCSVCRHQGIEFAEAVGDRTPVETGDKLTFLRLDVRHKPNVAVVDLLVIVVLDLHDLVARCKGPAKSLDLALACRIQCRLEFNIQGARSDTTAVHWAEHLHIVDAIETKAAREVREKLPAAS
jgi:hypothetical protein